MPTTFEIAAGTNYFPSLRTRFTVDVISGRGITKEPHYQVIPPRSTSSIYCTDSSQSKFTRKIARSFSTDIMKLVD